MEFIHGQKYPDLRYFLIKEVSVGIVASLLLELVYIKDDWICTETRNLTQSERFLQGAYVTMTFTFDLLMSNSVI